MICILLAVVLAFGEFVVVSRSESFGIYVVLGFSLKCNNSNSTLAVCSGFDLHRFLQVFGKKKIEKYIARAEIEPGSSWSEGGHANHYSMGPWWDT